MKKLLLLFISVATLSSCATVFCGSKAKIMLDANVESADYVTIDGYKHRNVTFPFQTKIRRGFDDTTITAEADGCEKSSLIIFKKFNPVSIINLTDIFGWAIDAATGAITKPEYKYYELEFEEKK